MAGRSPASGSDECSQAALTIPPCLLQSHATMHTHAVMLMPQAAGITHVWLPPPSQSVSAQVRREDGFTKARARPPAR